MKFCRVCLIVCLGLSVSGLANEKNEKVVKFGGEIPAAKKRYDAYVAKVRRQIQGKLNSAKFPKAEQGKRNKSDHFVVSFLSAVPKTKQVSAQFVSFSGVEESTEKILEYLKTTPRTESRDFLVLSRHSDASNASSALANLRGRETEMATYVKSQVAKREALRKQQLARAQYLAAMNAQRNRARSRSVSTGRRGCSGGG